MKTKISICRLYECDHNTPDSDGFCELKFVELGKNGCRQARFTQYGEDPRDHSQGECPLADRNSRKISMELGPDGEVSCTCSASNSDGEGRMAASGEPKVAKRRYMLADGGFFETEEPKHDWSGLKFVDWQDGECYLVDRNTERTLMVFRSDGEVLCVPGAYGGAGHFDEKGRLIVK